MAPNPARKSGRIRRFFANLGPGIVAGAADDDPSGIATCTSAGAMLGTSLLWTAFLTWPLMAAVQFMCARIGMVTGEGLGSMLRRKCPFWMVVLFSAALLTANTINIAADLSGMADAGQLLSGIPALVLVFVFGVGIAVATIRWPYRVIANALKWLALSLFAYALAPFVAKGRMHGVLHDTFVPSWPAGKNAWEMLVAILGTTISPYLFYWQAAEEKEEKNRNGGSAASRRGASRGLIVLRKFDVGLGTFFSNLVTYFIILTAAMTLHSHGRTNVETTKQAAEALRPIAGRFAALLYTAGLVGTGLLTIPTLSVSAAYALAETFHWRNGLDRTLRHAPAFYAVVVVSMLLGIGLNFGRVSPVQGLYWCAVVNGLVAPFLLVGILMVASDRKLMANQPSSPLGRVMVAITCALMGAAAVAMFVV